MTHTHIFTDGSVNTLLKVGYGAFLAVTDLHTPLEVLKNLVKVKRFVQTSSTKLELQAMLWSLNEAKAKSNEKDTYTLYTDSQNIIGLPGRRTRLERSNYISSKGKQLNNYELYQEFYALTSELNFELVKVVGHKAASKKDKIDNLFSLVDQASRRALREKQRAH